MIADKTMYAMNVSLIAYKKDLLLLNVILMWEKMGIDGHETIL